MADRQQILHWRVLELAGMAQLHHRLAGTAQHQEQQLQAEPDHVPHYMHGFH